MKKPQGGRKNMNLSKVIFLQLDALKKLEKKRLGVKVSWDRFFSDLCQRLSVEPKQ